jgi:hypothetical protein
LYVENTSVNTAYVFLDDLSLHAIQPTTFPQYINTGENTDSFHRRIKVDANDNVYVSGQISNNSPGLEFGLNPVLSNTSLANNRYGSFLAKYSSSGNLLWSRYINNILINDFEIMPNGNLFIAGETERLEPGTLPTTPINWVQTVTSQTFTCPSGNSITIDHTNTRNLFVLRVDAGNGHNIGDIDAYGGMGDEIAVEVEIIGNTAFIAANVNPHVFSVGSSSTGPGCNFTNSGQLAWKPLFVPKFSSVILTYDLSTLTRDWFDNYTPTSNFKVLQKHNTELVILTGGGLQKLSTSNVSNNASALVNVAASAMHVTAQGHIYLVRNFVNNMYNILEKRLVSNMAVVNATKTYQYTTNQYQWLPNYLPISVCSRGNDVYVLGQYWDFTNGNSIEQYYFDKLDLSSTATFGDFIWQLMTNSSNVYYAGYSAGVHPITQGAPLNNSNELAVIGNFHTQATTWQFNLPPKVLAGNNGIHQGNAFVAKIVDNGSSGQYNKQASGTASQADIEIFPNPANHYVQVRSNIGIQQIQLFALNGQRVLAVSAESQTEISIPLTNLPVGMYIIKVSTSNGSTAQKLSIE